MQIDFAYRTFRWDNEAKGTAAVHCVVIGFSYIRREDKKMLYVTPCSTSPLICNHINPYLLEGPDVFIPSRQHPISNVPEIGIGNQPIDDGNYLFKEDEKDEFLRKEPQSAPYFYRWLGADELIKGKVRYCLYLGKCPPNVLRNMPMALQRIENVRQFRQRSKRSSTLKLAGSPTSFQVTNIPQGNYLIIPRVSSERRIYVPMGLEDPTAMASDSVHILPEISTYHFGILTSIVHNAWMRTVAGRLEMRYRYSKDIVYNNFPWPEADEAQQTAIGALGQAVLDARALYPECSLADLYDPLSMPPELLKAHRALDRAVLKLYGLKPSASEPEMVAELFRRYQELTRPGK